MTNSAQMGPDMFAILGRVVTPESVIDDGAIVIDRELIVWVGPRSDAAALGYGDVVSAAEGAAPGTTILPGLVDIHCHGGGGESFPDAPDAAAALIAAREHLRHGTTSLVGSLVTADRDTLLARVDTLTQLCESGDLAGIHLEGPFLSADRCGAQDPHSMQTPDPLLVKEVAARAKGWFATMTVAPEIPGQLEVGAALIEAGAIPSVGHTDSSAATAEHAIRSWVALMRNADGSPVPGARSTRLTATHLFNGMRPLNHRDPGPIMACIAAAARGEMVVELVADGTHLADETVRGIFDILGPDAIMLVTDAMAAAGMPDGAYDLGPMKVTVRDGVARLAEGDAIAGGTSHLLDQVRRYVAAGVPVADVVKAASLTPATVLGAQASYGSLEAGKLANLVVVDGDFRALQVRRLGAVVA